MADAKRIIELAKEFSGAFIQDTRANGDKYTRLKDGAPEWMTEVCHAAHNAGAMLPDDERYQMIEDAADAIAEASEKDGDRDDFDSARSDMADGGSVYTNDRTAWLASRVDRYAYVDEAVEEYGAPESGGILAMLELGIYKERSEVFDQVLTALAQLADAKTEVR